jgi:hypothetical protein
VEIAGLAFAGEVVVDAVELVGTLADLGDVVVLVDVAGDGDPGLACYMAGFAVE